MDQPEQFEQASRKGQELHASMPRAVSARYDRRIQRVVIRLNTNVEIAFSPRDAEGLQDADWMQLSAIEISPSGFGIHFPELDADLYIPALLEGFLGSKRWMASRLGAQGGQTRSEAKTLAARRNGRLGGRPKKTITEAA
jgi:hypothetical protein